MKITLCGSAKFEREFKRWNKLLTLAQHVVYSLAVYPSDEGGKDWYTDKEKHILDSVHLLKIFNSDAIVVLNVGGYIGESTTNEIRYAETIWRRIYYIEPSGTDNGRGNQSAKILL